MLHIQDINFVKEINDHTYLKHLQILEGNLVHGPLNSINYL